MKQTKKTRQEGFREYRYKNQTALLDDAALLVCITDVDLNPIQVNTIETLVHQIKHLKKYQQLHQKIEPRLEPVNFVNFL